MVFFEGKKDTERVYGKKLPKGKTAGSIRTKNSESRQHRLRFLKLVPVKTDMGGFHREYARIATALRVQGIINKSDNRVLHKVEKSVRGDTWRAAKCCYLNRLDGTGINLKDATSFKPHD